MSRANRFARIALRIVRATKKFTIRKNFQQFSGISPEFSSGTPYQTPEAATAFSSFLTLRQKSPPSQRTPFGTALEKDGKDWEEKGTQTQTFWSGYFLVGWGSSTRTGGGQKVRYVPRNQGNQTFWAGYPGISPGYLYTEQMDAAVLGDRLPEVTQKPCLGPKSLSLQCRHWESSKVLAGLAFCEMPSQYLRSAF